jgi:hypothetical protein
MKMSEFTRRAEAAKAKARQAVKGPSAKRSAGETEAILRAARRPLAETYADRLLRSLQKDIAREQVARSSPGILGAEPTKPRGAIRRRSK